jgi:hypothetical protein
MAEGANTRRHTARRNPLGLPVHWCL